MTPMTATEARQQAEKLMALEIGLAERLIQLSTGTDSAGADLVKARIEGRDKLDALRSATDSVTEARVTLDALTEARQQRVAALQEHKRAEAAELQKQAVLRDEDADKREAGIREQLAAVEAAEGVRYLPEIGKVSKTQSLRQEAQDLRTAARSIERDPIPASGQIVAETVEQLLAAPALRDALSLAPFLSDVHRWAQEIPEKSLRSGRFRATPDSAIWMFELAWRDGQIDPERSWYVPHVAPIPSLPNALAQRRNEQRAVRV